MALGVTGEFYVVTFKPTSAAAWTSMLVPPGVPTALMAYVTGGTNCPIFVIDAASGFFPFPGGQASRFTDDLLASTTASLSYAIISTKEGVDTWWAKDAARNTYSYASLTGTLSSYTVGEAGDLEAFLP